MPSRSSAVKTFCAYLTRVHWLHLLGCFGAIVVVTCQNLPAVQLPYLKTDGQLVIDAYVSSSLMALRGSWSKFECLVQCQSVGCAAVTAPNSGSGACQLLIINDESTVLQPAETHELRVLSSEAGIGVWKAPDFDAQLLAKTRPEYVPDYVLSFKNTATGVSGSIQRAVLNFTGCYSIEAVGASGGVGATNAPGGRGAAMSGLFWLSRGSRLEIVVGQQGGRGQTSSAGGGGGGGSFVYRLNDSLPLVAAGGGGGATPAPYGGVDGQAGINGTQAIGDPLSVVYAGIGGVNGGPGSRSPVTVPPQVNPGGSGAGWFGRSKEVRGSTKEGEAGWSLANGWTGGVAGINPVSSFFIAGAGGFGGGGGSGVYEVPSTSGIPGGGGGYSGGATALIASLGGGGGGSYCGGAACLGVTGGGDNASHGRVTLRLVSMMTQRCRG